MHKAVLQAPLLLLLARSYYRGKPLRLSYGRRVLLLTRSVAEAKMQLRLHRWLRMPLCCCWVVCRRQDSCPRMFLAYLDPAYQTPGGRRTADCTRF
jgi:hypothetical protein